MAPLRNHAAPQAPGADAPTKENAPAIDRGAEGDQRDCAKAAATAVARAALLGIKARAIGPAAWLLRSAHGAWIGAVYGTEALAAAVAELVAVHADIGVVVQCMRGAA